MFLASVVNSTRSAKKHGFAKIFCYRIVITSHKPCHARMYVYVEVQVKLKIRLSTDTNSVPADSRIEFITTIYLMALYVRHNNCSLNNAPGSEYTSCSTNPMGTFYVTQTTALCDTTISNNAGSANFTNRSYPANRMYRVTFLSSTASCLYRNKHYLVRFELFLLM